MNQNAYKKGSVCPNLEPDKIYLYGMRFCPYVTRVRLVLAAMNIEYETININLKSKPEWFLDKFPAGKVPVLENNGKIISESLVITEYLNDTYPENKLYPVSTEERTHEKTLLEKTGQLVFGYFKLLQGSLSASEYWENIEQNLKIYEEELANRGKFFGGDNPMILDYVLWSSVEFILAQIIAKPDLGLFPYSKYPKISKWIDNISMDPVVKKTCQDRKLIASYLQTSFDGNPNYDIGLNILCSV